MRKISLFRLSPAAALSAVLYLVTMACVPVRAETTQKDVEVGARAAAFLQPALSGDIPTAVIYDGGNPASKADADKIMAALGSGLAIKGGTLKPKLVDVASLGGLGGVKVAFVADGLDAKQASVASAANSQGILTISSDMKCVASNSCVVGVAAQPKVQIVVSKAAREAAHLSFGAAFLMMIKEQ